MADPDQAESQAASFYAKAEAQGAEAFYDDWAADYEAETASLGLRLPGMAAAFLARRLAKGTGPILDAAAGTGQVGSFLRGLGYGPVHGLDISSKMLRIAERGGEYDALTQHDLGQPLAFEDGHFAAALLVGALGPGHAPPDCLRELARVTRPGGYVVFNVVSASWEEQGIPELLDAMAADGIWAEEDRSPDWDVYSSPAESVLSKVFCFRVL